MTTDTDIRDFDQILKMSRDNMVALADEFDRDAKKHAALAGDFAGGPKHEKHVAIAHEFKEAAKAMREMAQ